MFWAVTIFIASIALNFLLRRILRHFDSLPSAPDYIVDDGITPELSRRLPRLLKQFGKEGPGGIPRRHLPLGGLSIEFMEKYASFAFEDGTQIYDRSLLAVPYAGNPLFVQIGVSCNGDHILLKRHSAENTVYIVNTDEGDAQSPCPYASTIHNYLLTEYSLCN